LITVVAEPGEQANAAHYLAQLIDLGRIPAHTQAIVGVGGFDSFLEQAPQADVNIFGLQARVNLAFMTQMVTATQASCIFVRDSGDESALI
jgi:hypothetical protein